MNASNVGDITCNHCGQEVAIHPDLTPCDVDAWARPINRRAGHSAWSCNDRDCAAHPDKLYRPSARAVAETERRIAYDAGWSASKRSTTYDLDAAERRFERSHGADFGGTAFAAGWTDYAAGSVKGTSR